MHGSNNEVEYSSAEPKRASPETVELLRCFTGVITQPCSCLWLPSSSQSPASLLRTGNTTAAPRSEAAFRASKLELFFGALSHIIGLHSTQRYTVKQSNGTNKTFLKSSMMSFLFFVFISRLFPLHIAVRHCASCLSIGCLVVVIDEP